MKYLGLQLIFLGIICSAASGARAQNIALHPPVHNRPDTAADRGDSAFGSPEEEMIAKREVRFLEKSHEETVGRSREAARLASEVRQAYERSKALSEVEIKKLERLEKLTRRIRSDAGGSEGEASSDTPPSDITNAITRLTEVSDEIKKTVEDTPRQVVSARVIEKANELLEVAKFLRKKRG